MSAMVKGGFAIGALVSCVIAMGLMGGLVKAVKDKDDKKKKSIGISFAVFACLTIILFTIMSKIPI
jgi:O-antigen/teichoic acid export membrane protein